MLRDIAYILKEVLKQLPSIGMAINIIFGIIVVFYERRNPVVTWAWLMVITLIPYIGFFIYLLIGLDSRKYRVFAAKAKKDENIYDEFLKADGNRFLQEQADVIGRKNILNIPGSEYLNDMIFLNFFSGSGAYTDNNNVKLFYDGVSKIDEMLKDFRQAKRFIHLEYYIVRNDETGKRLIAALAEKAAQGVDVRFLADGMGCMFTPHRLFKPLIKAGGRVSYFLPPHFVRINFRNHRKICVIDGAIGYIGGLNIGNEYLGLVKRFGYWRDTHLKLKGDSIKQLELRFLMDWNFCSPDYIKFSDGFFPKVKSSSGGVGLQIVSSGPDTAQHNILNAYIKMISEANSTVYIQSPYFIPDSSIFDALRIAALSGIDVRIMIPSKPDHPFVYWASLSYLGELVELGAKCYRYEKGFVHSKIIMIDSLVSSVGTANMDIRSFKLNFECNAFIYDQAVTKRLEEQFIHDIADSARIEYEWYIKRGNITKIRESVSRLLSPLL
ncbi:MAG: cardiolipin synthase [Clostridiales bacterium]|jgi:cardiolipin synthase|nr:cardiolipin synthase [Clostridiales bacterium]